MPTTTRYHEDEKNDGRRGSARRRSVFAIRKFADGEKVIWCDFNAKYLDAKDDTKWIMPDRVHPNEAGYRIWTDAVLPYFKSICGN